MSTEEQREPKLSEVRFDKRAADRVRNILDKIIATHKENHGDEIAGFALVTWDRRGSPVTGFLTSEGMVHRGLMPAYVHDALMQHVIRDMQDDDVSANLVLPDDPA